MRYHRIALVMISVLLALLFFLTGCSPSGPIRSYVTLDRQSGTGGRGMVIATYGEAMPSATPPTRAGYTFGGYYDEADGGGTQYYTDEMVSARSWDRMVATTLFARWTGNIYGITLDMQGGMGGSERVDATYGSAMPAAVEPTRTGYPFGGYYDAPDGRGKQYYTSSMVSARSWDKDQDGTLFAMWQPWSSIPMTFVEGGTYQMGFLGVNYDETPMHTVQVDSFYIGTYEVTQDIYEQVVGSNPSNWKGARLPVEQVTWHEAIAFCNALSRRDGLEEVYTIAGESVSCDWNKQGYRLPTEAEWEYAARGGNKSRGYIYAGSDVVRDVAWYGDNSGFITHEVGGKAANELGLYDMSGNVMERCWDWYGSSYYSVSPVANPSGPSTGSNRVCRGGGWYSLSGATSVRTALRTGGHTLNGYSDAGIRVLVPVI